MLKQFTVPTLTALLPLRAQAAPALPPTRDTKSVPANADHGVAHLPFEVPANTKGYYSANTMSEMRPNTNVKGLASLPTVVTKEQMADFAMLDINDIFVYPATTEGTGTDHDFVIDRNSQPYDNMQLNSTVENRVRGIAAANISLGNIGTIGAIPDGRLTASASSIHGC